MCLQELSIINPKKMRVDKICRKGPCNISIRAASFMHFIFVIKCSKVTMHTLVVVLMSNTMHFQKVMPRTSYY